MKLYSCLSIVFVGIEAATAQACGGDSGRCALNACCSSYGYCGTSDLHCNVAEGCQSEFGSCGAPVVPSCNPDDQSASRGRQVGYYMAGTHGRQCNAMPPKDVDPTGYTHLFFAFAHLNQDTFQIEDDVDKGVSGPIYEEFTSLQSVSSVKTWIAVGGGSQGYYPWFNMASNNESRATFIESLSSFMDRYNFSGVDLDYEFPPTIEAGERLIDLVKEMRAAWGNKYGMSISLSWTPETLSHFIPTELQHHVDFMSFMTYDYNRFEYFHTLQAHTDMVNIEDSLSYIWKAGIDPQKLNLGLAFYGYSYVLQNSSCTSLGCPAKSVGTGTSCVRDPDGILPLFDIEDIISMQGVKPWVNETSMTAHLTYDNGKQFVSCDNQASFDLKLKRADEMCLGGVMVWAVSFATNGRVYPNLGGD